MCLDTMKRVGSVDPFIPRKGGSIYLTRSSLLREENSVWYEQKNILILTTASLSNCCQVVLPSPRINSKKSPIDFPVILFINE